MYGVSFDPYRNPALVSPPCETAPRTICQRGDEHRMRRQKIYVSIWRAGSIVALRFDIPPAIHIGLAGWGRGAIANAFIKTAINRQIAQWNAPTCQPV